MSINLKNLTMKDIKRRDLLVSHEDVIRKEYNTPSKMRAYKRELKKFSEQCKREVLKEFGNKIKKVRKKEGLTQSQLAELLNTSRTAIIRIEKGDQNLTVEYIAKITTIIGIPFKIQP